MDGEAWLLRQLGPCPLDTPPALQLSLAGTAHPPPQRAKSEPPFSFAVTKSKCPSYVGVTGILLQETKHVFKIITKEDRLKGTRLCPRAMWAVVARPRRQPFPCSCEGLIWPQVSIRSRCLLTPH